jgi:hypothetical protein
MTAIATVLAGIARIGACAGGWHRVNKNDGKQHENREKWFEHLSPLRTILRKTLEERQS